MKYNEAHSIIIDTLTHLDVNHLHHISDDLPEALAVACAHNNPPIMALLRLRWENGDPNAQRLLNTIPTDRILAAMIAASDGQQAKLLTGLLIPGIRTAQLPCSSQEIPLATKILQLAWQAKLRMWDPPLEVDPYDDYETSPLPRDTLPVTELQTQCENNLIGRWTAEMLCHEWEDVASFWRRNRTKKTLADTHAILPLSPETLVELAQTITGKLHLNICGTAHRLLIQSCAVRPPFLGPIRFPQPDLIGAPDGENDFVIHCQNTTGSTEFLQEEIRIQSINSTLIPPLRRQRPAIIRELRLRRTDWGWRLQVNGKTVRDGGPFDLSNLLRLALGLLAEAWYASPAWLPDDAPSMLRHLPRILLQALACQHGAPVLDPFRKPADLGPFLTTLYDRFLAEITQGASRDRQSPDWPMKVASKASTNLNCDAPCEISAGPGHRPWDPRILAVWQAVLPLPPNPEAEDSVCSTPWLGPLQDPQFWAHPYLSQDVCRIRAARRVLRCILYHGNNSDNVFHARRLVEEGWQAVCSDSAAPANRTLRVTLAKSHWDIITDRDGQCQGSLIGLANLDLPVPRRGIELLAALAVASKSGHPMRSRFLRAPAAKIAAALDIFRGHRRRFRVDQVLADLHNMLDYEGYAPTLAVFARRSREWHDRDPRDLFDPPGQQDTWDDAQVLPPCPREIPSTCDGNVEIQVLSTVGAVRHEGRHMQHCVASYIDRAMQRECWLLHVALRQNDGTVVEATVELRPVAGSDQLTIAQVRGPKNGRNAAVDWVVRRLGSVM